MIVSIIVAASDNHVIGANNDLIWHLPADMAFFKNTTMGHHILMGRKNFESIPERFRPLPGRTNLVISRAQQSGTEDVHYFNSIEEGIEFARQRGEEELFIIGGGEIYRQSMDLADRIYLTRVHGEFEGDTFFPEVDDQLWQLKQEKQRLADEKNAYDMTFTIYEKK